MKKTYITILVFVVLAVLITLFFVVYKKPAETIKQPEQIVCTMEAKLCPDGSYVGRVPPSCEFTVCPTTSVVPNEIESTVAKLNQRILTNGVYITPLEVKSDSRCAIDVKCIWAGTVTLLVKLESGGITNDKTLTLGTPTVFAGKQVVFEGVTPAQQSKKKILSAEYQFEFLVTDIESKG